MRISSIGLVSVSEMTHACICVYLMKTQRRSMLIFFNCATLLILIPGAHVSSCLGFCFACTPCLRYKLCNFFGVIVKNNVFDMKVNCIQSLVY